MRLLTEQPRPLPDPPCRHLIRATFTSARTEVPSLRDIVLLHPNFDYEAANRIEPILAVSPLRLSSQSLGANSSISISASLSLSLSLSLSFSLCYKCSPRLGLAQFTVETRGHAT